MEVTATALISGPETREGVEHPELATEIATLHSQCFAWALACCDNRREDAEDVLQDVYVSALDNGLRFDGRSTLKTWIFGVIRHKARSHRRRERLRALLGVRHAHRIDIPTVSVPDDDAIAIERAERTRAALGELSPRQREVLLLVFYHDLTVEEAAGIIGCSLGSARVHYERGKKRLAKLLDGDRV
jgi:RNA polymerase sigma factor (sigma-70 family)